MSLPPARPLPSRPLPTVPSRPRRHRSVLAGLVAGQAYLNIHTTTHPGGEIRGVLLQAP